MPDGIETIGKGPMECTVTNETFYCVYTFNTPQPVNLKAGSRYLLIVRPVGTSKQIPCGDTMNYEVMFKGQLIKSQQYEADIHCSELRISFSLDNDAQSQLSGRVIYQGLNPPKLDWLIISWPIVTGIEEPPVPFPVFGPVLASGTQQSSFGPSGDIYTFNDTVSLKAGNSYKLTISPAITYSYWENISFNDQQIQAIQKISTTPDYVVQISPKSTAKSRFSARLESQSQDHKTVSWKLEGFPAVVCDAKLTFVNNGSITPQSADGYTVFKLDVNSFNVEGGSYVLTVQGLPGADTNTFWIYLASRGCNLAPTPVDLPGESGYNVQFTVDNPEPQFVPPGNGGSDGDDDGNEDEGLNNSQYSALKGVLQYAPVNGVGNINWNLYRLPA